MEDFNLEDFKDIFDDDTFVLPVRWDGNNYINFLEAIYNKYVAAISSLFYHTEAVQRLGYHVRYICDKIIESVKLYMNGKPSQAYEKFNALFLERLMVNQFTIYNTFYDPSILENKTRKGRSKLFRVRCVSDNKSYCRKDIFHTPFFLRNKIASTRYSIAGYPSLYLSSSLELCLEELEYEINPNRYICSRFELVNDNSPRIIELGIKPSDFYTSNMNLTNRQKLIDIKNFSKNETIRNYYLWFPLIIACSFIRINRKDPFAIEYVVPQLLMQSVRNFKVDNVFMGIRYFSCSSEYSSELGFNYVFPTNFNESEMAFCPILSKSFLLTKPLFLNEYKNISFCEMALRNSRTDFIETA